MSKIDELIKDLCPEGVSFAQLKNVAAIGTGSSDKKDSDTDGPYPFFVRSKQVYQSQTFEFDETAILIPGEGGIGEIFHFHQGPYALHQRAYRVAPNSEQIESKFLFYFMVANFKQHILARAVSATVTSIRKPMIESFPVALPPLEVQREIVSILDKFTQLEAELEAELEARRIQYEVTRDRLLDFSDTLLSHPLGEMIRELCPEGVGAVLVGDLFAYEQPTKYLVSSTDYVDSGTPVLTAGQTFLLGYTLETEGIYPASPDAPVIIFDDFTCGIQWVDFPFKAKSSAMKMIRPRSGHRDELRLLYHWMGVKNFKPGEHARHWISVYSQFEIPLPPLEIQTEIVSILDKLDALVNDITIGLPAEIAARRKQYEYYRNKLLTFKELEAA